LTSFFARASRIVVVAAAAAWLAGCGINNIPTLDENVNAEAANLQTQYQRRADLIPNLVNTVSAAAQSERATLDAVVSARARATSIQLTPEALRDPEAMARFEQAQGELTQALSRLLMVTENYPQLQTNQNFLVLQSQLEGTENRIAIQRRDYNEAVRRLNTEMRTFPGSIWANTVHSGVDAATPFQASATAQTAPTVNFPAPTVPSNAGTAPAAPPAAPAAPAAQ
jgi:LemA protein